MAAPPPAPPSGASPPTPPPLPAPPSGESSGDARAAADSGSRPGRLARPKDDRVVAGVAAGIANHFGVDPVWVRVLFVLGTFTAFAGVVIYIVMAFAMPEVDQSPSPDAPTASPTVFWVGAAVALFLAGTTIEVWPRPGLFIPIAIAAVGVALWQRPNQGTRARGSGQVPPPVPPGGSATRSEAGPGADVAVAPATAAAAGDASQPTATTGSGRAGVGGSSGPHEFTGSQAGWGTATATTAVATAVDGPDGTAPTVSPPEPPEPVWWTPPTPRARPSWLGPLALVGAVLTAVVQASLDGLDVINVTPTQMISTALVILGVAMLAGTFWGHAKWLSAPAIVLAAVLLVVQTSSNLGIQITPTVTSGTYLVDDVDGYLGGGVGEVTLDLAAEPPAPGDTVEMDLGIGSLVVVIPADADVHLRARAGVGEVELREPNGWETWISDVAEAEGGWEALRARDDLVLEVTQTWWRGGQGGEAMVTILEPGSPEPIAGASSWYDTATLSAGMRVDVDRTLDSPWSGDGPAFDLDVGVGAGQITIVRALPDDLTVDDLLEDN